MKSLVFDSVKGQQMSSRLTICEVHRRIYDRVLIAFEGDSALPEIVKDLEDAFVMGVKMNARLLERRIETIDDLYPCTTVEAARVDLRRERVKLSKKLKDQREWIEKYASG